MSEALFDQYKAALRRGHMAALGSRFEEALEAYSEAARLVPERPLPFASRGTVLHRLDRWPEAAEAFDQALRIAPDDEATLRARAVAREERGMLSGAADDFERLALILDVAGQGPAAIEAAQKATLLESTPARLALASRLASAAVRARSRTGSAPGTESAAESADGRASPEVTESLDALEGTALDDGDLPPPVRVVPETDAEAARNARTDDPAASWPQLDMPSPMPALEGPPPDPDALLTEAAEQIATGNVEVATELMLTAVMVHRAAGRLDAALDICLQLLAIVPGDPHVHLAIANLQLDHGWTPLAKEKIELLLRLTALTGDTQAEADVRGLAAERFRDEAEPARAGH